MRAASSALHSFSRICRALSCLVATAPRTGSGSVALRRYMVGVADPETGASELAAAIGPPWRIRTAVAWGLTLPALLAAGCPCQGAWHGSTTPRPLRGSGRPPLPDRGPALAGRLRACRLRWWTVCRCWRPARVVLRPTPALAARGSGLGGGGVDAPVPVREQFEGWRRPRRRGVVCTRCRGPGGLERDVAAGRVAPAAGDLPGTVAVERAEPWSPAARHGCSLGLQRRGSQRLGWCTELIRGSSLAAACACRRCAAAAAGGPTRLEAGAIRRSASNGLDGLPGARPQRSLAIRPLGSHRPLCHRALVAAARSGWSCWVSAAGGRRCWPWWRRAARARTRARGGRVLARLRSLADGGGSRRLPPVVSGWRPCRVRVPSGIRRRSGEPPGFWPTA